MFTPLDRYSDRNHQITRYQYCALKVYRLNNRNVFSFFGLSSENLAATWLLSTRPCRQFCAVVQFLTTLVCPLMDISTNGLTTFWPVTIYGYSMAIPLGFLQSLPKKFVLMNPKMCPNESQPCLPSGAPSGVWSGDSAFRTQPRPN